MKLTGYVYLKAGSYNSSIMFTAEDILCNDKFMRLESAKIAYLKQDLFYHSRVVWRGKIQTVRPAAVWITGHSDYGVTSDVYLKWKHVHPGHWFTVNKEHRDPMLHAIPLGITNDCDDSPIHRIFGNVPIMLDVMREPRVIRNMVYMNFTIQTWPRERTHVFGLFKDKPWVTHESSVMTLDGRKAFLQSIRNHQFVLCPRGNGVDTHRLWETLYMGSIPIVVRHIALEEFTDLPICWIDRWEEVTPEFLQSEFARITETTWNLEKLTFGYWKARILSLH